MVSESLCLNEGARSGVIQKAERGVPELEHQRIVAVLARVHWDDLHVMRGVAEHASFRQAASHLKISLNTLRGRVSRLETAMETRMFVRDRNGVRLTPEGRIVLQVAQEMRALSGQMPLCRGNNSLLKEGEIRIGASEGLGSFWLTPRLSQLKDALPDLLVSLDSFADQDRIHTDQFDIAISYNRPSDQDAIISKLGTVHMMPYASESYLERFGEPARIEDVVGHRCVQQEAEGLRYDSLPLFLGGSYAENVVSIRVNSSMSLLWAVASGAGIGCLPTYVSAITSMVRPIALPIRLKFEIWMSFNPSGRDSNYVRKAIDWVRSSFDPVRYPWFAEDFVNPDQFDDYIDATQALPIFDQVIDAPF